MTDGESAMTKQFGGCEWNFVTITTVRIIEHPDDRTFFMLSSFLSTTDTRSPEIALANTTAPHMGFHPVKADPNRPLDEQSNHKNIHNNRKSLVG